MTMRLLVTILLAGSGMWKWLIGLGGPGLIVLGLVDNSAIPLPGSMDVLVVVLSAHHRSWWPYYAIMAVIGATIGGYLTYRLAEKGGEGTLEKKVGKRRAEKVYSRFKKHGFATIVVGAILPPPFPVVPFLLAAGALHYPKRNFLAALATGRAVRYFGLAYLGHRYGVHIVHWLNRYYQPILYTLITLAVVGGLAALWYFKSYRPGRQAEDRQQGKKVEEFPLPFHQEGEQEPKQKRAR
jgi:membrane protein YqaA with SNARE-associated domain